MEEETDIMDGMGLAAIVLHSEVEIYSPPTEPLHLLQSPLRHHCRLCSAVKTKMTGMHVRLSYLERSTFFSLNLQLIRGGY